jgi:hypothetical protein
VILESLLAGVLLSAPTVQAGQIPAAWQPFARCVAQRESNGRLNARNPRSSAQGRWQFLDQAWRVDGGIEWIVSRQLRKVGMAWKDRAGWVRRLDATPIYRWPAWAQDAAFVGVVTERSSGWRHWHHPGSRCNALVPK